MSHNWTVLDRDPEGKFGSNSHIAGTAKPMILDSGFGTAIVTVNQSLRILQMRRHRLHIDQTL